LMFTGNMLGNAVGATALGWSFQLLRSYNTAFSGFAVLMVIACAMFLALGPYRYPARGSMGVRAEASSAAAA